MLGSSSILNSGTGSIKFVPAKQYSVPSYSKLVLKHETLVSGINCLHSDVTRSLGPREEDRLPDHKLVLFAEGTDKGKSCKSPARVSHQGQHRAVSNLARSLGREGEEDDWINVLS